MEKDCCKVSGSLCGLRGSHHQRDCPCTGCAPTTRIVDRLSDASMWAVVDWAGSLSKIELKEFGAIVGTF